MVGKKWLQLVKSLHQKKYRNQHQLFFLEGTKAVNAVLNAGFSAEKILVYEDMEAMFPLPQTETITENELKKISALQHASGVLGVFGIPPPKQVDKEDWIIALDDVRDPGNLGTLIRLCDWFGVQHLVCSPTTVDCYNPKVLQATMGSIAQVNIRYEDLSSFFEFMELPVYGALMQGKEVYTADLPSSGILLLGNEAHGISKPLQKKVQEKITIPRVGTPAAESLNVAMAAGILLNEIRRR